MTARPTPASPTRSLSSAAAGLSSPGWARRLAGAISQAGLSPEERYLRKASDLADLERRLRWLEQSAPIALDPTVR
ncbi:hypothetical protein OOT46_19845 [Aquabacterium sp. A7-Y]|uniref:hypothetical protein n=1 Tax=Aquabacterium sp. A7-Y TaxID=1349605 RepID=UPI00223D1AA3|nr:hypothetical protein [Aquabacterium sp. A7-Y]MCW7540092.1 hypothetical protein [Aquabacterium sp. A7-Y]